MVSDSHNGTNAELSRQRALHASVRTQLSTELMVTDALWKRSRDQHRSQIFLQHVSHVRRLGRLLLRALGLYDTDAASHLKDLSKRVRSPEERYVQWLNGASLALRYPRP